MENPIKKSGWKSLSAEFVRLEVSQQMLSQRSNSLNVLKESSGVFSNFDQQTSKAVNQFVSMDEDTISKLELKFFNNEQTSTTKELFSTLKEQNGILKGLMFRLKQRESFSSSDSSFTSLSDLDRSATSDLAKFMNESDTITEILKDETNMQNVIAKQAGLIQDLLAQTAEIGKIKSIPDRTTLVNEIQFLRKQLHEKENLLKLLDEGKAQEYSHMLLTRHRSRQDLKALVEEHSLSPIQQPFHSSNSDLNDLASHLPRPENTIHELKEVRIKHKLGEGSFGEVYYGLWIHAPVALKKLRNSKTFEFAKEAMVLSSANHPNILRLLGIYRSDTDWFLVTEYVPLGSLKKFISSSNGKQIEYKDLLRVFVQVASGMAYLESEKILHCDLAARNVLISKETKFYVCKIADFGLAINPSLSEISKHPVPIKWSPPEVISHQNYSHKSDVYSFGIVCWEVLTYGEEPFNHLANEEVLEELLKGKKPVKPFNCSINMYKILCSTWEIDPKKRPSFTELIISIKQIYLEETLSSLSSSDFRNYCLIQDHEETEEKNENYV